MVRAVPPESWTRIAPPRPLVFAMRLSSRYRVDNFLLVEHEVLGPVIRVPMDVRRGAARISAPVPLVDQEDRWLPDLYPVLRPLHARISRTIDQLDFEGAGSLRGVTSVLIDLR